MPQRQRQKNNRPAWFEVTGWHGDRATRIALESRAELAFWQRVIAHELGAIEGRLDGVLARADRQSTNYQKVQRLRSPDPFDLTVQRIDVPPADSARRDDREPRALGQASVGGPWPAKFRATHPEPGSLLAIGCSPRAPMVQPLLGQGWTIEHVVSGEGTIKPARCGLPDRHRAEAASFAGWLVATTPEKRRAFDGVILGASAGALDIEGLRHRLFPHQCVIADGSTTIAAALERAWDGTIEAFDDGLMFSEPGPGFLDPMTGMADIGWPKISVVTVSYNQSEFLEDCLRSVLDQDYPNLEYIVIDAVSNDGSIDILRRYEHRLSKLVIEPDGGQSEGLNKGLDMATGDILTWINSDDMLAPGALRRAALAFHHHGADMVAGGCERISENSDHVLFSHHVALPFLRTVPLGLGENYMWTEAWEQGDYVFQPEVLFTRDIWRRAGGYLKQHLYWAMDWELWLRMAMAGATIVNIPETIGRSRQQDNQKTTGDELYLFQIKNILVEHNEALSTLEKQTAHLPLGRPRNWKPNQAMKPTMTATADRLKRLWALRDPRRLWQAISKRLPAPVTRRILSARRRFLYRFSRPRLVSGVTYARWTRLNQVLADIESETRQARRDHQALLAERDVLSQHCNDLKAVIKERFAKNQEATASSGAGPLADFLMTWLFDAEASSADRLTVATLLANGQSVQVIARTLAIQHFSQQSAPNFELARPLLAIKDPFPASEGLAQQLGRFKIVDIGSEALAFENDIYAALIKNWPAVVLGFDPFADAENPGEVPAEDRPEVRMRTMKTFVGTGEPATFHVNRMQATSSLLPGNQALVDKFSLLSEALETLDQQTVETARLDDLLSDDPDFADAIDFLKIDVQGGSLEVLEGAKACLARTLVCQVEAEFSEVYQNESLFNEIDAFMRKNGFVLLDFANLGRQRYKSFDSSATYFFQAGRLLWADCIYVRHLDRMHELGADDLLKLAIICHEIYQKPDCAAEALCLYDERTGSTLCDHFIESQDLGKATQKAAASSSG